VKVTRAFSLEVLLERYGRTERVPDSIGIVAPFGLSGAVREMVWPDRSGGKLCPCTSSGKEVMASAESRVRGCCLLAETDH
jgi:hypothetical protein